MASGQRGGTQARGGIQVGSSAGVALARGAHSSSLPPTLPPLPLSPNTSFTCGPQGGVCRRAGVHSGRQLTRSATGRGTSCPCTPAPPHPPRTAPHFRPTLLRHAPGPRSPPFPRTRGTPRPWPPAPASAAPHASWQSRWPRLRGAGKEGGQGWRREANGEGRPESGACRHDRSQRSMAPACQQGLARQRGAARQRARRTDLDGGGAGLGRIELVEPPGNLRGLELAWQ